MDFQHMPFNGVKYTDEQRKKISPLYNIKKGKFSFMKEITDCSP